MDLELKGKVALVTAGGGGLGTAIALALASEGATVAAVDLSQDALDGAQAAADSAGTSLATYQLDLSDPDAVAQTVDRVGEEHGPIDILVNITGGPPPTEAVGVAREDWGKYFDQMVASVITLTDLVLPGMMERQWGRVITSTSSGAIVPIPNLGISNTLRASLHSWNKTAAREVGSHGVTMNIVLPGRIATQRIKTLDEAKAARDGRSVDEVRATSVAGIPVGRYGEPDEYGSVVAFLASERASYVTGSVIRIDGGLIDCV